MAKIYISYSRKDSDFVRSLIETLKNGRHEIIADIDTLAPGQDWRNILSEGIKSADVFVVILSKHSSESQYTIMELGSARAYSSQIGKPLIFPIAIEDIPVPPILQDINILFLQNYDTEKVLQAIDLALSVAAGQEAAKEKKAQEVAKKIEINAAEYIVEAINAQRQSADKNNFNGKCWYFVGFMALITGIGFALASLYVRPPSPNLVEMLTILVTNIIVIGFLGACSRYAFALGKSYVSESLKSSDRIHAIEFGRFYLRAFGERASWSELKEVFQHWNIDRASAFSTLDASNIDPQVLNLIGQVAGAFGGKGKDKEKEK